MTTTIHHPDLARADPFAMDETNDPAPEIFARARPPRRYSAKFKAEFLERYDLLDKAGKGALLRREGLYSSLVSEWRKQRDRGALAELARPSGRPPVDPRERELARSRRPTGQMRPLTLPECARIAGHLHVAHQLAFWLQRIMRLRISEAFGVLVSDVVDLGDTGLLAAQGQGGRMFKIRDEHGAVVAVPYKATMKTAAGCRVLVVPSKMMEIIRVAIEAFHTDPDTSEINQSARLIPDLQATDRSSQAAYRHAFDEAPSAWRVTISASPCRRTCSARAARRTWHGRPGSRTPCVDASWTIAPLRMCLVGSTPSTTLCRAAGEGCRDPRLQHRDDDRHIVGSDDAADPVGHQQCPSGAK
jgi:transposase-like protein